MLTIKAQQMEKALSDSVWPCGVSVRRYKQNKGTASRINNSSFQSGKTQTNQRGTQRKENFGSQSFGGAGGRYVTPIQNRVTYSRIDSASQRPSGTNQRYFTNFVTANRFQPQSDRNMYFTDV